jgi:hypothetical protein
MGPLEEGIPPVHRRGRERSALADRMCTMEVGQSFLADSIQEHHTAQYWTRRLRPKKFSVVKVPYLGWRVWRIE